MSATQRRSHYQVTFAVLAVSVSAFALLQSLVVPVLAEIQADLHTSQTTVTWVLTAYLLSASVCTPIVGRVGDKVGKERMLVVALVALSVGSLIAALATSIGPMIVGRVIQGVGGGVLPLSFGIIRDEFPEKKVPSAVGAVASLAAVGRRPRARAGRAHRQRVRLPLAVLVPDDHHRRALRWRPSCSSPSRRSAPPARSASCPPSCCRRGWCACCWH